MLELMVGGYHTPPTPTLPEGETAVVGQVLFAGSATEKTWVVPEGVNDISVVMVAGGARTRTGSNSAGGRGGDLRWGNRIKVTPGETLTIKAGTTDSRDSYLKRDDAVLLQAVNGSAFESTPINPPLTGGGDGGAGCPAGSGAGGGGAGGYSGNGGDGGDPTRLPTAGEGGAGGGGRCYSDTRSGTRYGCAGGGVGLLGEGSSGGPGLYATGYNIIATGEPGSGGKRGSGSNGAVYGSGAGTTYSGSATYAGGNGGVRIIWGPDRLFPTTNTADM